MSVTLSKETFECIGLFQAVTSVTAKDCIVEDGRIVFIVEKDEMGTAIGAGGKNIRILRNKLSRRVKVFEFDQDPSKFLTNLLDDIKPKEIKITKNKQQEQVATVTIFPEDKGKLIGSQGKNIKTLTYLLKRHHSIDNIMIKTGSISITAK